MWLKDLSTYQLVIDLPGGSTANWGLWALGHFSRPFRVPFLLFRAAVKEGLSDRLGTEWF